MRPDCRRFWSNVSGTGRPEWGGVWPRRRPRPEPLARPGPRCPGPPSGGALVASAISSPGHCVLPLFCPPLPTRVCLRTGCSAFFPDLLGVTERSHGGLSRAGLFSARGAGGGRAPPRSWAGDAGGAPVSRLAPSGCWAAAVSHCPWAADEADVSVGRSGDRGRGKGNPCPALLTKPCTNLFFSLLVYTARAALSGPRASPELSLEPPAAAPGLSPRPPAGRFSPGGQTGAAPQAQGGSLARACTFSGDRRSEVFNSSGRVAMAQSLSPCSVGSMTCLCRSSRTRAGDVVPWLSPSSGATSAARVGPGRGSGRSSGLGRVRPAPDRRAVLCCLLMSEELACVPGHTV